MGRKDGKGINMKWDWVGVFFAISGLILNAQQSIYCWPCFMYSTVFMGIHFLPKREYPFLFLTSVYFCLDIWAWYSWTVN